MTADQLADAAFKATMVASALACVRYWHLTLRGMERLQDQRTEDVRRMEAMERRMERHEDRQTTELEKVEAALHSMQQTLAAMAEQIKTLFGAVKQ